ncbi:serine/threonine-protein kinase, partial [Planctomycetota bacterium]|nr:serine/threonine-protein kinase [Planctomycetota bacterium]
MTENDSPAIPEDNSNAPEPTDSDEGTLLSIPVGDGNSSSTPPPSVPPTEPDTKVEDTPKDGETLFAIGSDDANQSILFQIDQAQGSRLTGASIDLPAGDSETQSSNSSFRERHTTGQVNKLRYDKLGELGRGGMGVVLKVKDNDLRREVAMKVIRADRNNEAAMYGFIEEAQITGQLEHPNIVPVHEIGTDSDGQIFFTMKMVRGQPLSQVLRAIRHGDTDTAKRHTLDRMLQIMLKVCDAVSFAAARGVVHRDLKPENIMLGRFGEVVVMDWGLARVQGQNAQKDHKTSIFTDHTLRKSTDTESNPSSAFSMEGSIAGTPAYMAPEQAKGEISKINESTDIFALGAILCEMLCLHGPYLGKGRNDVLEAAADGDVTTPLERIDVDSDLKDKLAHLPNNRIPPELDAIAAKAMQFKQRDRYDSVRAF